jgi:ATP-dependent DNA ligase
VYLDGEVVVLDDRGISSFGALQEALSAGDTSRMAYFAFDLLHLDGRDLMGLPLVDCKSKLEELFGGAAPSCPIRYCEHTGLSGKHKGTPNPRD